MNSEQGHWGGKEGRKIVSSQNDRWIQQYKIAGMVDCKKDRSLENSQNDKEQKTIPGTIGGQKNWQNNGYY